MAEWFSIEVVDGTSSSRAWADAHGDTLIWAAQFEGATDWAWHDHRWGVVLEIQMPDEQAWDSFREQVSVRAALDAVPDPVSGLIVHRGRGGSAGTRDPRRPRPIAGAGAAALPLPVDELLDDDVEPRRLLLLAR